MNRQTLMFAVLFIVALACWRVLDRKPDELAGPKKEHFQPDFVVHDVVTRQYDKQGRLTERLTSRYGEYFRAIEMANLQQPELTLYNESGVPEWRVKAKEGVWNANDSAVLRNEVHADGLLPDSFVKTLDTEYMELDLTNQDVRSNKQVLVVGPSFQTQGVGLRGNLNTRYFELLEQSHAIYFNEKR